MSSNVLVPVILEGHPPFRGENPGSLGVTTRLEQWVSLMSRQVFQAVILRVCDFFGFISVSISGSLSLSRGCRFSLFSAKPCTPMLNFFARSGPKIEKIDSSVQGEGRRA